MDTTVCAGCDVQFPDKGIDGSGGSFLDITVPAGGGQITVRATAPSGRVFAGGANAGALINYPVGNYVPASVRFNTYRAGMPVDVMQGGTLSSSGQLDGAGQDTFYSVAAGGSIDSVEAVITLMGNVESKKIKVYELCGDR